MNILKNKHKEMDVSQVKVKHVIDFESKLATPVVKPPSSSITSATKISLSKKIEYPGICTSQLITDRKR